jgi:hypothetical protein
MRRQQHEGREGTGVGDDEVRRLGRLGRSITDLRDDLEQRTGVDTSREARLYEGTEVVVRLEEGLSSRTACPEDRVRIPPIRAEACWRCLRARAFGASCGTSSPPSARRSPERWISPSTCSTRIARDSTCARASSRSTGRATTRSAPRRRPGWAQRSGGALGRILAGKSGAIAGVLIGAGGAVVATKGQDLELPAGTLVTLRLERQVTVPRDELRGSRAREP